MPTISHLPVTLPLLTDLDGVRVRRWSDMALNDDGQPIILTRFNDRTIHVSGTFGSGGLVVMEGSNDGVEYLAMRDVFNNVISASTAKLITLTEVPVYVRPRVTGGDGTTSITLTVAAVGKF
jgi:hypothetical protein